MTVLSAVRILNELKATMEEQIKQAIGSHKAGDHITAREILDEAVDNHTLQMQAYFRAYKTPHKDITAAKGEVRPVYERVLQLLRTRYKPQASEQARRGEEAEVLRLEKQRLLVEQQRLEEQRLKEEEQRIAKEREEAQRKLEEENQRIKREELQRETAHNKFDKTLGIFETHVKRLEEQALTNVHYLESAEAARRIFKELKTLGNEFFSAKRSIQEEDNFIQECKGIINPQREILEQNQEWGVILHNLGKAIVNAVIGLVYKSNFFPLTRTDVAIGADTLIEKIIAPNAGDEHQNSPGN